MSRLATPTETETDVEADSEKGMISKTTSKIKAGAARALHTCESVYKQAKITYEVEKFRRSADRGQSMMDTVVSIAVALIVAGAIVPTAITQFTSADTTNWPSEVQQVWDVLPVVLLLGILIAAIGYARDKY